MNRTAALIAGVVLAVVGSLALLRFSGDEEASDSGASAYLDPSEQNADGAETAGALDEPRPLAIHRMPDPPQQAREPLRRPATASDSEVNLDGLVVVPRTQESEEDKLEAADAVADERGRISGTGALPAEETAEVQNFARSMDHAFDGVREGFGDCFEQAPALQGQALAFQITRFDSGRDSELRVSGADVPVEVMSCFQRKVNAVELPESWRAATLSTDRYSVDSQTAAEFSWKFELTP